jgi:histidyl-tRNA synthetase
MEKMILPGMFDIVPEDTKETFRSTHLWHYLETEIRSLCKTYGFEEIRTPILEKKSLFLRSVGETSDVASKELYEFKDKGDREIALRPEGTASAMRAYMDQPPEWQKAHNKLYYIEPMFRYDRPQAGRYRQHHQFGIESIGAKTAESDAECIDLLYTLFQRIGIENVELNINSIGTLDCRKNFIDALRGYYSPIQNRLSDDSKRRLEQNPLRILDSKDPIDIALNKEAPSILNHLNQEAKDHFKELQKWLKKLGIPYKVNHNLVRGLDYYNHTVFEMVAGTLGAQNSIGGGGRYDGLLKKLGGPDLPAFGFGTGLERVLQTMLSLEIPLPQIPKTYLYLIPLGEKGTEKALELAKSVRMRGVSCEVDLSRKKIGKMMELSHARGAEYTSVIGDGEIAEGVLNLKDMKTGKETKIPFDEALDTILLTQELPKLFGLWESSSRLLKSPKLNERFLSHLDHQIKRTEESLKAIENQVLEIKKTLN